MHKSILGTNISIYYEAAVAGAIPIIRPLRESLAGDQVKRVIGIVNGTTNYILSEMKNNGLSFETALSPVCILIPHLLFIISYFCLNSNCLSSEVKFHATVKDTCILSRITSCCNPVNFKSKNLSEDN